MWPFSTLSLEQASDLNGYANIAIVIFGALTAAATLIAVKTSDQKEHFWDVDRRHSAENIAKLENDTQNLKTTAEIAKAAAAAANERAEELRRENIDLTDAVAPRNIEQFALIKILEPLRGRKVYFQSVPDFEARRFARFIQFSFINAGLNSQGITINENLSDGVNIHILAGPVIRPDKMEIDGRTYNRFDVYNANAADVIYNMNEYIRSQRVQSEVTCRRPDHRDLPGDPWHYEPDAIVILVGMKPTTFFDRRIMPWIKEIQNKNNEMNKRAEKMMLKFGVSKNSLRC